MHQNPRRKEGISILQPPMTISLIHGSGCLKRDHKNEASIQLGLLEPRTVAIVTADESFLEKVARVPEAPSPSLLYSAGRISKKMVRLKREDPYELTKGDVIRIGGGCAPYMPAYRRTVLRYRS
jgi:hypothetical protein